MENFNKKLDKVFTKSSKYSKEENMSCRQINPQINDRLLVERQKALTTLQKAPLPTVNKQFYKNSSNKENSAGTTDYNAMPAPLQTINISDLVKDETINLQMSNNSTPQAAATTTATIPNTGKQQKKLSFNNEDKISFEINEITGRSTLYNLESRYAGASSRLSVSDILATSCAPKVRDLRGTLRQSSTARSSNSRSPNSTTTSSNDMHSLPRTADMSSLTNFERIENESNDTAASWSVAGIPLSFSFARNDHINNNNDNSNRSAFESNESFAPAELMQSKLLNDEIAWAQERATIPIIALSKEAKAKINAQNNENIDSATTSNNNSTSPGQNSMINSALQNEDPNFSLGRFFQMRSENLSCIVNHQSPEEKKRDPIALVDDTIADQPTAVSISPSRTNRPSSTADDGVIGRLYAHAHGQNSKDSGNATTDSSYLLSVSAVDRALNNLNLNSDESHRNLFEKLFKIKISPQNNKSSNNISMDTPQKTLTEEATISKFCDFISYNKENIDPLVLRNNVPVSMHDTQSFSESMLNASNMNKLHDTTVTSQHSRLPLSPVAVDDVINNKNDHDNINVINIPKIEIISETGIEADLDEWPSSPVITAQHRRVLRKKSPSPHLSPIDEKKQKTLLNNNCSPAKQALSPLSSPLPPPPTMTYHTTPRTSLTNSSRSNLVVAAKQPGLCSTRLEIMSTKNETEQRYFDKCTTPTNSPYGSSATKSLENNNKNVSDSPSSIISGGGGSAGSAGLVSRTTCSCGSPRSDMILLSAPTRSVSRCSSTSEFTHRVGQIVPIKVTALELSWPSTKLRTTVRKSMQVKNIADKRLILRIEIIGPGFQILNMPTSNLLTLQSQECRSIKINFCPTVTGVASGILAFYTANSNSHHHQHHHHHQQQQQQNNVPFLEIPLNAYGGHCRLVPQNIFKGPVGPHYINMGDICDLNHTLERTFQLYNTGSLCGFFSIGIDTMELQLRGLINAFTVEPQRSLIHSGGCITVRIVFQPRRDDIRKVAKRLTSVPTLAQLRIISGDEANRQRMRRLYRMMPSKERSKLNAQLTKELWSVWPDEKNLDDELKTLQEAPDTMMDLINCMKLHAIALTLSNDDNLDDSAGAVETSSLYYPDADETVLFRTVCAAQPSAANISNINTVSSTTPHMGGGTADDDIDSAGGVCDEVGSWYVTPKTLKFDFFSEKRQKNNISLVVHNSYKSRQYFEASCNQKHLLHCTPSEGYIAPDGGYVEIFINSNYQTAPAKMLHQPIFITVYMENEQISVPVEVPDDNYY